MAQQHDGSAVARPALFPSWSVFWLVVVVLLLLALRAAGLSTVMGLDGDPDQTHISALTAQGSLTHMAPGEAAAAACGAQAAGCGAGVLYCTLPKDHVGLSCRRSHHLLASRKRSKA